MTFDNSVWQLGGWDLNCEMWLIQFARRLVRIQNQTAKEISGKNLVKQLQWGHTEVVPSQQFFFSFQSSVQTEIPPSIDRRTNTFLHSLTSTWNIFNKEQNCVFSDIRNQKHPKSDWFLNKFLKGHQCYLFMQHNRCIKTTEPAEGNTTVQSQSYSGATGSGWIIEH